MSLKTDFPTLVLILETFIFLPVQDSAEKCLPTFSIHEREKRKKLLIF